MRSYLSSLALAGACLSPVLAQDPLQEYTISAENISATYIPYGARLTSLTVPDRDGTDTEVVVGYDDASTYVQDTATNHTYFGEFQVWPIDGLEILVADVTEERSTADLSTQDRSWEDTPTESRTALSH